MKKFLAILIALAVLAIAAGCFYLAGRTTPPPSGTIEHTIPDDRIAK